MDEAKLPIHLTLLIATNDNNTNESSYTIARNKPASEMSIWIWIFGNFLSAYVKKRSSTGNPQKIRSSLR